MIGRILIFAVVLGIVPWLTEVGAGESLPTAVRVGQGEVVVFRYQAADPATLRGWFRERPVTFFHGERPGSWSALLGADLEDPPGPAELTLELAEPGEQRVVRIPVEVSAAGFGTQAVTLPKRMVDLDARTLARVNAEQARLVAILERSHSQRLWRGAFLLPTEGQIAGSFGMRRLLNGQPRSPHGGEDIVAPRGTPVRAAQAGIVRLVDDHFFSGKSVILDHGLGLFTVYFHLSEASVREGATLVRGDVVGKVGATGRVTGSHLHWGAILGRARVNPVGLLTLPAE